MIPRHGGRDAVELADRFRLVTEARRQRVGHVWRRKADFPVAISYSSAPNEN